MFSSCPKRSTNQQAYLQTFTVTMEMHDARIKDSKKTQTHNWMALVILTLRCMRIIIGISAVGAGDAVATSNKNFWTKLIWAN